VSLTNIHSYVSGSGDNRSQREKALWQDTSIAHAELGVKGTRLTFRFDVPEGFNESDTEKDDSYHVWRLNLRAELDGTDLDRNYDLPVYATATQSRFLSNIAVQKSHNKQRVVDDQSVRDAVNLQTTASGPQMLFPIGRHVGSSIGGLVIGGIFAAAGWFLIFQEGHPIFGSVFGGMGSLIAIACLYMMLNSLQITVHDREIVTIRRLLGIPISRKSMHKNAFARFGKASTFKTQTGSKHVVFYSVHAIDRAGNKLVVGEGFKGESEANAAMRLMSSEFGLQGDARRHSNHDDELYGAEILS
jgi:hypothetical protein